ncbi:uncharacterized protein BDZ99DRAFT_570249 [Mytilinidion resinicola]|uniref:NB-ARC domain-containing protein n=1 Tax=Mytilinidion resinicola TaxID=574789 RepID=A0A6A6YQZ7_9PEZI|nr:uncharacterized protein BDZ99DRAFT_570249 [Mytilinidion resinicola]KAF2810968.1 hypothetical protein BDZ99DRAFT_570249 [Mytilinidion resinicola]
MYKWYANASRCYAYLADVSRTTSEEDSHESIQGSKWFCRGWTLQELLAPKHMILYGSDWCKLGTREELSYDISVATGIHEPALRGSQEELGKYSVAQRMSWASRRETTRPEDMAYCLLGLFNVNMPLLYGEGGKNAFIRLQEEIMKNSDDHTLFAWTVPVERLNTLEASKLVGLLAEDPVYFRSSEDVLSFRRWDISDPFSMTNKGLRITVPLAAIPGSSENWTAYLDCHKIKDGHRFAVGVTLKQLASGGDQFARVDREILEIPLSLENEVSEARREIYIRKDIIEPSVAYTATDVRRPQEFRIVQTPESHSLIKSHGCVADITDPLRLLAPPKPPKTTWYWVDPHSWANWHVACHFEARADGTESQTSNFNIVLGYDGKASRSWCMIEQHSRQQLQDIWDEVRYSEWDVVSKAMPDKSNVVEVRLEPSTEKSGIVEVKIRCRHDEDNTAETASQRSTDPFSIISLTVDVAYICAELVKYLKDINGASAPVHEDIELSIQVFEMLDAVNKAVRIVFRKEISSSEPFSPDLLWVQIEGSLRNCRRDMEKLRLLAEETYGEADQDDTGTSDWLMKARKALWGETYLKQCRNSLSTYYRSLHHALDSTKFPDSQGSNGNPFQSFIQIPRAIQKARSQLSTLQYVARQSGESHTQDDKADFLTSPKLHTYSGIPRPISSIFTGQKDHLERLKNYFLETPESGEIANHQKRFVVYGIGGSGKTQFCIKLATENRDRYWGVFWIDMSSPKRATTTYAEIAKIAGVEPTMNAVTHWLSNLERQWLLIIDDVDGPQTRLEDFFPKGSRGHVLVTTRNPEYKRYGNVGCRFFAFQGLDADDATVLLLRAADLPEPWDENLRTTALEITEALGYHALAMTQAGTAVSTGLSSLKDYLAYNARSFHRTQGRRAELDRTVDGDVYASFEIIYSALKIKARDTEEARDAVQLFNIFAFFHHENIQFDILARSVKNRKLEQEHEVREREKERSRVIHNGKESWSSSFRRFPVQLLRILREDRGPSVLPAAIRDARNAVQFDQDWLQYEDRLRAALKSLVQMSLIVRNDSKDDESYSMHPLVHAWARERHWMNLGKQALWSEAAATTLSYSLLLPPLPLGDSSSEEAYRAAIFPHIDHVLKCQRSINSQINKKKMVALPRRPCIAYVDFGRWSEAEELQVQVQDFLLSVLGIEHVSTRRIILAHAKTLRELGRTDEAEKLQLQVLDACKRRSKVDHHEVLVVKEALAETLSEQFEYSEAVRLQKDVISGFEKLYGRKHEDTLTAISNLGMTVMRSRADFIAAQKYNSEALKGMEELLGPTHLKTLIAKERLAVIATYLEKDLDHALELINEVCEEREKRLGNEHPYTLLAMAIKGRTKRALGDLNGAEMLLRSSIAVMDRTLGRRHQVTLRGQYELAMVCRRQGNLEETERNLPDVIELSPGNQILVLEAMYELFVCYKLQGRKKECLDIAEKAIQGFEMINPTKEPPLARKIREERRELVGETERLIDGVYGGVVANGNSNILDLPNINKTAFRSIQPNPTAS